MENGSSHPQIATISGGKVFDGASFGSCDVHISGKQIVSDISASEGEVLDASGCYVLPGFIDLHFHGSDGADMSDGDVDGIHKMARYEASRGITAICPATMTISKQQLLDAARCASEFKAAIDEADLVGINMEGPYISPSKIGAQNPIHVRVPDIEEFEQLQIVSGGLFKIVDLAPEEDGADEFIERMGDKVRISVAHTCADYETSAHAFDLGAKHLTHLYNAMDPMHHRKPGPIPAAAERSDVTAEIIADGIHIHPAMVRLAFNIFGDDRMILVSDTLRAAGLKDGIYDLGGQDVEVKGYEARIENGALAGSVSDLMRCFYVAVHDMDIPLISAVKAATVNPARALGISESYGSLSVGHVADAVLIDEDTLELKHVVLRGKLIV